MTTAQKYDNLFFNGETNSFDILFPFGELGNKIMDEAIKLNAYVKIFYSDDNPDQITKYQFISADNKEILKSVDL